MSGKEQPSQPVPPPDAHGHDSLADLSEEAVREIEKRRDGSGGYSGEGDIG
jgi:hypothetical protein